MGCGVGWVGFPVMLLGVAFIIDFSCFSCFFEDSEELLELLLEDDLSEELFSEEEEDLNLNKCKGKYLNKNLYLLEL